MLRFLVLLLCLYLIYRLLFASRKGKEAPKQKRKGWFYPPPETDSKNQIVEEMKRCPSCGTFNPKSLAVESRGEYFCNKECREKLQ